MRTNSIVATDVIIMVVANRSMADATRGGQAGHKGESLEHSWSFRDWSERKDIGGAFLKKREIEGLNEALGAKKFAQLAWFGEVGDLWGCVKDRGKEEGMELLAHFAAVIDCFPAISHFTDKAAARAAAKAVTLSYAVTVNKYADDAVAVQVSDWIARAAKRGDDVIDGVERVFRDNGVVAAINKLGPDKGGQAAFRLGKIALEEAEARHKAGSGMGGIVQEVARKLKG